ncbi:MAG TPA: hypothetical protein VFZ34_08875 [Blastocatellia bacterium]|nr:hypothetical protein [Blastocatellia bacterium]
MDTVLLLTILTILAAMVLLIALGWGLHRILKALEGIGQSMDKIAMGVRAIEVETAPLPGCIDGINNSLAPVIGGFEAVGSSLTNADQNLGKVAGVLGVK